MHARSGGMLASTSSGQQLETKILMRMYMCVVSK